MPAQWTADLLGRMHLSGVTARQLAADLKLERADYGLINNGTPEELSQQIDLLLRQFS